MTDVDNIKHLGQQSQKPIDTLDVVTWKGSRATVVTLEATEFTSHCPVTRQPDFGRIIIRYAPDEYLVETKSLKLWLWAYRDKLAFNERLTDDICERFFEQVKPRWVEVTGAFNVRGGISVTACCRREAP